MICDRCKEYVPDDVHVCPNCGNIVMPERAPTMEDMRQGRLPSSAPQSGNDGKARFDFDPAFYTNTETLPLYADSEVYDENGRPMTHTEPTTYARASDHKGKRRAVDEVRAPRSRKDKNPYNRRMINWARMLVVIIVLVILLVVGVLMYLYNSQAGQRLLARAGIHTTSAALWEVGEEKMNVGDIEGAIEDFIAAAEIDGAEDVSIPGLLMLGSAYEVIDDYEHAEQVYRIIFTDLAPSVSDSYTNCVRIMLQEGRDKEAAELLKTAYQNTGNEAFRTQRAEIIPQPPEASVTAGYYEQEKELVLVSPQGYDVYYTFDTEAKLPEEGILFTQTLLLDEASWNLRAVCVSGDLVSNELSGIYRISMPSPQQPYANLAPNAYKKRKQVQLWASIEEHVRDNITIYYTIDGSQPNADSPIYDGTPFWIPSGRAYLKAVSVNEYGKASNTLEVEYKIEQKPYPKTIYSTDDTANGLRLNTTTYEDFTAKFGASTGEMEVSESNYFTGDLVKYPYSWGYAVFNRIRGHQVLIELYFTDITFKGPRSTAIGDTLESVVGQYRDCGQVESPSGNRGLYGEAYNGYGRILKQDDGSKIVRYQCYTVDSTTWQLDYICTDDVVTAIDMLYIPE